METRETSDDPERLVGPLRLDVRLVVGSTEGPYTDPVLRGDPFFRQPPLDRYRSLRVMRRLTTEIHPEEPTEIALPESAPFTVTVDRTFAPGGRMSVRMLYREQPAYVAASRDSWFLLVPGHSVSTTRHSHFAVRLRESS